MEQTLAACDKYWQHLGCKYSSMDWQWLMERTRVCWWYIHFIITIVYWLYTTKISTYFIVVQWCHMVSDILAIIGSDNGMQHVHLQAITCPQQMLSYCDLDQYKQTLVKFISKHKKITLENTSEKVISKMVCTECANIASIQLSYLISWMMKLI